MGLFKLAGAGGVILSGIWFYFLREGYFQKRDAQLEAYIKLLFHIKNKIECYALPIDRIIADCDKKVLKECGADSNMSLKTLADLLNGASLYIDERSINILYLFAEEFGTNYLNEQITLCDKCLNDLKKIHEENKNQRAKDKKLSLAICLSISLSLILILI